MKTILFALLFMLAVPVFAQDHADIDKSSIIGNRELPKVLYIVPWKKPLPGDLSGRPLESVLDEALAPLDKDVFQRQVQYAQPAGDKKADSESKTDATAAPNQTVPTKSDSK